MRRLIPILVLAAATAAVLPSDRAVGQVRPIVFVSALGRCLDVSGGYAGNGAAIQLWDCNGTPAQQWIVQGTQIQSALGRCLDVTSGNPSNGTRIQLWDCNGTPAQQWSFAPGGALRNGLGLCLDVSAGNPGNGAAIQSYQCNGTPAQTWMAR